jgi:hypothetical protein
MSRVVNIKIDKSANQPVIKMTDERQDALKNEAPLSEDAAKSVL